MIISFWHRSVRKIHGINDKAKQRCVYWEEDKVKHRTQSHHCGYLMATSPNTEEIGFKPAGFKPAVSKMPSYEKVDLQQEHPKTWAPTFPQPYIAWLGKSGPRGTLTCRVYFQPGSNWPAVALDILKTLISFSRCLIRVGAKPCRKADFKSL